jgi:carboxymethylenebutenolidase
MQILSAPLTKGPCVLVLHSWWGLTASFVNYGQALANAGFTVGLADLFSGQTAETEAQARRLRQSRRREPTYRTLVRNIGELREEAGVVKGAVGLVGFSMGGHWAVWLSRRPDLNVGATVLYYAARAGDFSTTRSSYVAHFAETDPWVSTSARRGMEKGIAKAGRSYQAFDYPGTGHWFAESDRAADYHQPSASLAFDRTCAHLTSRLYPAGADRG